MNNGALEKLVVGRHHPRIDGLRALAILLVIRFRFS